MTRLAWPWFLAVAVLACVAIAWLWHGHPRRTDYFEAARAPRAVAQPAPQRIDANGKDASALAASLSDRPDFANDVVFLVVAAMRGRCEPAHAHELAAMASRARLPVLAGVTEALGDDGDRRDALLGDIRDIAARAPCQGAFEMGIGAFRQRIDAAMYAAAFPDSYFDPGLDSVPKGFAGATLAERAVDDCNRVAYAVLPLDQPRAWQCTALRAAARRRVLGLCHQDPGSASGKAGADDTALRIRGVVEHLPPTCQ